MDFVNTPHPKLVPLLEKHGVDYALFRKQGRPRKGEEWVIEKRRDIITELHEAGTSWAEMVEVTGLGNGAIQRLTRAMWNESTRSRVRQGGVRLGKSWKGRKSGKKSEALRGLWEAGTFDFHRGRVHTPEENRQKASYTPEVRAKMSEKKVRYIQDHPEALYSRGTREWIEPQRCTGSKICVRSSYETGAVRRLDGDTRVRFYDYEPVVDLAVGGSILPDFVVTWEDGSQTMIEVKPSYVLKPAPENEKVLERLKVAEREASARGWGFLVWTEKELKSWLTKKPRTKSAKPSRTEPCESALSLLVETSNGNG